MTARHHLPPTVISAEDAPAFWRVGILWNISLSAATTAGELTMMDQTMPQGSGAPPHVHERYDEGFFIIEGAVEYTVGDDERVVLAEAGAAVWIPRGTRHAFEVKSPTARALNFYTPGGFDESISMLAIPTTARTLPPADSGEQDPRGFHTDPDRQAAYRDRTAELHSRSMPDAGLPRRESDDPVDLASIRMITDDLERVFLVLRAGHRVTAARYTPVFARLTMPSCTLAIGHTKTTQPLPPPRIRSSARAVLSATRCHARVAITREDPSTPLRDFTPALPRIGRPHRFPPGTRSGRRAGVSRDVALAFANRAKER